MSNPTLKNYSSYIWVPGHGPSSSALESLKKARPPISPPGEFDFMSADNLRQFSKFVELSPLQIPQSTLTDFFWNPQSALIVFRTRIMQSQRAFHGFVICYPLSSLGE